MYVIDCGFKQSTIYNSDKYDETGEHDEVKTISHEDVLSLPQELPTGSTVVCEYAHLGCPRKEKSLAQVFTEGELLNLYEGFESNDITLKLFPQQSTPRACNYSKLFKSDTNDPKAIYKLLKDFPQISLMIPPKNFEPSAKREESYEWVEDSNLELNKARAGIDKYKHEDDCNHQFLMEHYQEMYDKLSEDARSTFGFELYKKGNKNKGIKKGDIKLTELKRAQIFSVLVQFQGYDGNLRFREGTKDFAGWKFIKRYAIKMTPFHFKGGVARSNLYYHGMRNWGAIKMAEELGVETKSIKKKRRGGYFRKEDDTYVEPYTPEEDRLFLKYRAKYCRSVKELFSLCKEIHSRGVHTDIPVSP